MTANVATMHARSTLVHAARARAAPPFDPCRRVRGTRAPPCPAAPTDGRLVRVTRRVTSPPKPPPPKQPPHNHLAPSAHLLVAGRAFTLVWGVKTNEPLRSLLKVGALVLTHAPTRPRDHETSPTSPRPHQNNPLTIILRHLLISWLLGALLL